ncbi:unnamed protein product [Caenorhabditis auriculariae]|uniref:TNFR-Cys domain-containing protein n=1 Tax=Caenorhabditis auriculariae TaxID=2777116 RepID=A0A8S1GPK0_9PELO|nr:unnamed protein product [Caenorhabditis auriculariae]
MRNFEILSIFLLISPAFCSLKDDVLFVDPNEIFASEEAYNEGYGEYLDEYEMECRQCTICSDYLYEREPCEQYSNTVCGWCGSKSAIMNDDFVKKCSKDTSPYTDKDFLTNGYLQMTSADVKEFNNADDDNDQERGRDDDVSREVETYFDNIEPVEDDDFTSMEIGLLSEEEPKQVIDLRPLAVKHFVEQNKKTQDESLRKPLKIREPVNVKVRTLRLWPNVEKVEPELLMENKAEESQEEGTRIKWDKWIDDYVKPIKAEKQRSDSSEESIVKQADEMDEYQTIVIVSGSKPVQDEEEEEEFNSIEKKDKPTFFASYLLLSLCVCTFLIYSWCCFPRANVTHRTLHLDPVDIQILNECGTSAEAKNRSVDSGHINPLFVQ